MIVSTRAIHASIVSPRWLMAMLLAWIGCATAPPPYPLPAGIAELVLPADAATLRRIAAEDDGSGRLDRRRDVVAGMNRQLLMPSPDDALVPELFDFAIALAPRMESGVIDAAWGSYLYTTYQRELHAERPAGHPRRAAADIDGVLDGWVEFYRIRANPRVARPAPEAAGFEATQEWRTERRRGR